MGDSPNTCKHLSLMRFPVATFLYAGFTVACVVFCAILFYYGTSDFHFGSPRHPENPASNNLPVPVVIEARGHLFEWSFRYPGRDRKLGTPDDLRFDKELHLPVGVDVELKLESDDYMYIFSNAELGLRQIAVPELTYTVKFQAAKAGSFDLLADPLCGWRSLHDDLMGRIIVQSAPEFDVWFGSSTANLTSRQ